MSYGWSAKFQHHAPWWSVKQEFARYGNPGPIGVDPVCNKGIYMLTLVHSIISWFSWKICACFCLSIDLIVVWWWYWLTYAEFPTEVFRFLWNNFVLMSETILLVSVYSENVILCVFIRLTVLKTSTCITTGNYPNPRGLSMPALQYNVFIHDVDKLYYVCYTLVHLIAHVTSTLNCWWLMGGR